MATHKHTPSTDWHGAKFDAGIFAERPTPTQIGQVYLAIYSPTNVEVWVCTQLTPTVEWFLVNAPVESKIRVREVDSSPDSGLETIDTLVLPNGTLGIVGSVATYTPTAPAGFTIEEVDGSPTVPTPSKLVMPNGSLSVVGDVVTYTDPGGSSVTLPIREFDTTPNISADVLEVPNQWLSNPSGDTARLVGIPSSRVSLAADWSTDAEVSDLIDWDDEDWDDLGGFDLGSDTSRFTNTSGQTARYRMHLNFSITAEDTGLGITDDLLPAQLKLRINNTTDYCQWKIPIMTAGGQETIDAYHFSTSFEVELANNDYVQLLAGSSFSPSGTMTIYLRGQTPRRTWWEVQKVS